MSHIKRISVAQAAHCIVTFDQDNEAQNEETVRAALAADPLGCLIESILKKNS